jgi:cysteine desulfurase/selenocysteine lyase
METNTTTTKTPFDVESLRSDFPILSRAVNGQPLAYLDNGATAQKPQAVLEAITAYYNHQNSNVHRGVHALSQEATDVFEQARDDAQEYFNAQHREEIIFTNGTTDSINLLATSFGRKYIAAGDEVILSEMEHHSNIVPWQMLCQEKGAQVKYIPVTDSGELDMQEYRKLLSAKTKLVAVAHVSNVLGTINPVEEIIALAHERNIPVLLDGAQAVPHMKVDFQTLDCDFYAFSAHKMFGPTGMGILYGKKSWLEKIPPYQGGGEMIKEVTLEGTTYNELPYKFEAGTPNISAGVALSATFRYLNELDMKGATEHEHAVFQHAMEGLSTIEGIRFIGTAKNKVPLIAFVVEGIHHYDIGMLLDKMGIAVRTGHSCAQPLMQRFGITGTVRASLAFYNTIEEADRLVAGVKKAVQMLRP